VNRRSSAQSRSSTPSFGSLRALIDLHGLGAKYVLSGCPASCIHPLPEDFLDKAVPSSSTGFERGVGLVNLASGGGKAFYDIAFRCRVEGSGTDVIAVEDLLPHRT